MSGLALADKTVADMERYAKLLDEKLLTVDLRDGLVDKADEEKRRCVVARGAAVGIYELSLTVAR